MLKKNIVIIKKRYKKKNRSYLTIFFSLFLLVVSLLFLWNREFLSRLNHIEKNVDKVIYIKSKFLLFLDGEKHYNLNMEKKIYEEITFDLKDRKILDIYDEKNILFQEREALGNTIGDRVEIKKLESITTMDNYIIVKADGKYGAFDNRLNVVVPIEYTYLAKGEELFLARDKRNKFGYLNLKGKVQIPFDYDEASLDKAGEMVVSKEGKVGIINTQNKVKLQLEYNSLISLFPYVLMRKGDDFYFYSPELSERKLDISWAGLYNGETIIYEKDSKFGLMRKDGKKLTDNIYNEMGQKNIDIIITRRGEKYGLINQKGVEIIENKYDYILPIKDNFFIVGNDGNESAIVINNFGSKLFYEERYSSYHEINEDFLVVYDKDRIKLLNKFGKFLDDIDKILALNEEWLVYSNNFGINYVKIRGEI